MQYDPKIHHRHTYRLRGYDYSQEGLYFITIVTQGRLAVFGEVATGEMRLNPYGEIAKKWWKTTDERFPNVTTEIFIVMPNHIHGIIKIDDDRKGTVPVPEGTRILIGARRPRPCRNRPWDRSSHFINTRPRKRSMP